jgi:ppGpp synthetase/RelA/SpoT-type nucleotidyltranferase
MALDAAQIRAAVARYEREYERYARLAARVGELCRVEVVEANAIRGQVTFRAKSPRSLQGKLIRKRAQLACVDDVFSKLGDLAGVRIATYAAEDEAHAVHALMRRFTGPGGCEAPRLEHRDKRGQDPTNFYRATHLKATLPPRDLVGEYAQIGGLLCEIQVCSLMASAWNEIEHEVRYKHAPEGTSAEEGNLLRKLGQWTEAGDELVSQLLAATAARQRARSGAFEDVHDFVARMRPRFPGVDVARHAGPLFDALAEAGLNNPLELVPPGPEDVTSAADQGPRTAHEDLQQFGAWLRVQGDRVKICMKSIVYKLALARCLQS